MNKISKGQYTAHREQEGVITRYIDIYIDKLHTLIKVNLFCVQQRNFTNYTSLHLK